MNGATVGRPARREPAPERRVPRSGPGRGKLTIGRARPEDLVEIVGLLLRAIPQCVPQTIDQLWDRGSRTWVVREGGRVLASAALAPVVGNRLELRSVVVDPEARGRGVGRALVDHVLRSGVSAGREIVCVTRSPGFFRGLGFEPIGTAWDPEGAGPRTRRRVAMHRSPRGRAPK